MGVEGPRKTTESKQKQQSGEKLTHKAPHEVDSGSNARTESVVLLDPKTAELMAIWDLLNDDQRDRFLAVLREVNVCE